MSDKPISVGDLVCVVRGCPFCGNTRTVGRVFKVNYLEYSNAPMDCCGDTTEVLCAWEQILTPDCSGESLTCIKRIDPLGDLTDTSESARKPVKETA